MEQNLNLYYVFYEVANSRNFSLAAEKLFISQPAVSKSISRLEENLNTVLFHRSSRGVMLTTEGELLYQHVEKALLSLSCGENLLKSITEQKISHLSIGVSTTLCKYVLLPLLKEFTDHHPQIKLTISCQSSYETLSALKKGQIDLGLVGIPDVKSQADGITYLPLQTIEDSFVAAESYLLPFRSKSEPVFLQNLMENASFILLNRENISRKHVDAFLKEQQLAPANIMEVNNMELSIEFARAGLGIACVIGDFVREDIKKGTLHQLKLVHRVPKRQIGFAYPSEQPLTEGMETFMEYYKRPAGRR